MQLKVGKLLFEYKEFGKKEDPAIIMIVGLGEQLIHWHPDLCQGLANEGFRVIIFDNRDVGLSSKFEGKKPPSLRWIQFFKKYLGYSLKTPYTISDMADDVIGIMDALKIPKAHIIGSSMGGLIAQVLAIVYPNRIYSLVTIFPTTSNPALKPADSEIIKIINSKPDNLEEVAAYKTALFELLSGPNYPLDAWQKQEIAESVKRSYYPEGVDRQLAALVAEPATSPRLRSVKLPILVIHGDQDRLVPIEHGFNIAENAPNSKMIVMKGMGHVIPPVLISEFVNQIANHCKQNTKN